MNTEDYIKKWSKQGRSEDQIWAVRNFMTGQGALMMNELVSKKYLLNKLEGITILWHGRGDIKRAWVKLEDIIRIINEK